MRLYLECMRQPGHAEAGSRWYRSFQTKEMLRWMRGEYNDARVEVPVRWLTGTEDPVITADLTDGYADHISDFEVELVDGVGHWIVGQRPDLVLDRLRASASPIRDRYAATRARSDQRSGSGCLPGAPASRCPPRCLRARRSR